MSPHTPPHTRSHTSTAPRGFTLVELMVVIVIISILLALLLPAIGMIRAGAQVTEVKVEISGFESDITTFKTEFGIEPPSGIILYEDGTAGSAWSDTRSRTLIRRLWPQFAFSAQRDINGDGDPNDVIQLTGAECLVFFLGGVNATNIVNADGSTAGPPGPVTEWTPLGFSQNVRNPFERGGGNRIGPFHEFDGARLVNRFSITGTGAGDHGMPEYLDPLPGQINPYLYATSYEGKGYQEMDLGGPRLATLTPPRTPVTSMVNVYLQKDGDLATPGDTTEVPWNQTGFQIISPGFDTEYGIGGIFESGQRIDVSVNQNRSFERDNITNFVSGLLEN